MFCLGGGGGGGSSGKRRDGGGGEQEIFLILFFFQITTGCNIGWGGEGKLEVLGRSCEVWGRSFPPPPLDRTLHNINVHFPNIRFKCTNNVIKNSLYS